MADGCRTSQAIAPDVEAEFADFSYIVSHDLAAVFRHMQAFSALLARDLGEEMSPRQREYVTRIEAAAGGGQAMLDELRALSRLQRRPIASEICDVSILTDAALLQLDGEIRRKRARIEVGELGEVRTDQVLFVEALRRVLDNALKFARPDTAPEIEIRRDPDAPAWSLLVLDRGIGIDAGQEEKVFQMFHRLRREGPGSGAGLTIARRLLRRQGGEVRVRPQAEGACIELELPQIQGED